MLWMKENTRPQAYDDFGAQIYAVIPHVCTIQINNVLCVAWVASIKKITWSPFKLHWWMCTGLSDLITCWQTVKTVSSSWVAV